MVKIFMYNSYISSLSSGVMSSTLISNSVGSALSSVPLGPFTVTTFPSATVTSTPAGIATGSLPKMCIRDSS